MKHITLFLAAAITATAADHEITANASFTLPTAQLQQSVLTGSTNMITASWIPITTGSGATIYANVTIQFNVDASGNMTIANGVLKQVSAPAALTSAFRPGRYVAPGPMFNGKGTINVSGPGITLGGATLWTLAATSDAYWSTYPSNATWYTGSIDANPLSARIRKAGITSPFYSYGALGTQTVSGGWVTNALIGVSQGGNTITILNFTDSYNIDHAIPVDQITFTVQ